MRVPDACEDDDRREVLGFAGVTTARLAAEPFLTVDDVAWPARRR